MSVVTFLFTDIEGSTRRWEAAPDAMRVALETHNETLRKAVEVHAGNVLNYTGDGMCAVFDSPTPAGPVRASRNATVGFPAARRGLVHHCAGTACTAGSDVGTAQFGGRRWPRTPAT